MVKKNHCGYIAVIGQPNVGKSTLINCLVGQKISITARKPQTTRHRILGIKTIDNTQAIYVDTPGLHKTATRALNQYMNVVATSVINDVDLILFVIDSLNFKEEDEWVLSKLEDCNCPIILVINKVDRIDDKLELLPAIEKLEFISRGKPRVQSARLCREEQNHTGNSMQITAGNFNQQKKFIDIFPISAKKNQNVAALEKRIFELLPESPHYFDADDVTDRSLRFMAAELIREKLIRNLGQEVPHSVTVQIDQFKDNKKLITISATILVERQGQKAIVVGKDGQQLKIIGTDARLEMEKLFDKKVFLRLWVKVKSGWSNDTKALKSLGYD